MKTKLNGQRIVARIALAFAFMSALSVAILAFVVRGIDKPETWTTAAATLAVITSIISAWSGRRVVELQEDAKLPNPHPIFDFSSRYGLVMLRVRNSGGSLAQNITLEWDRELKNYRGETIGFFRRGTLPGISLLLAGESMSQNIDVPHNFIRSHPSINYTGFISFEDASGRRYRQPFSLDGRTYEGTAMYDDEAPKTNYELQQIPTKLQALTNAVKSLKESIDRENSRS